MVLQLGHGGRVNGVAFSPDGQILASASDDDTVKLWNPATGALLRTLAGHRSAVQSVAFSPDGRTLASASWDNTVKLWNRPPALFGLPAIKLCRSVLQSAAMAREDV